MPSCWRPSRGNFYTRRPIPRPCGRTREEVVGYTSDEVFGADNAAEVNRFLAACLSSGAPYRYERMQGEAIIEAIATPVPHEAGAERRLVVSAGRVTGRR